MKIEKIINNNLVRSINDKGQFVILMGCGIGFQKKVGSQIDESKVNQVYILQDKNSKLEELLTRVPEIYIKIANEVINYIKSSLGKKLNDNIYITLTDHISFAVERFKKGIVVKNALLWEIRRFYNHEYLIAKEALQIIKRRLNVELPEDEAGFIALHIVNASMNSMDLGITTEMTKVIDRILSIVKYHFKVDIDEYSLHYERFLTHLKFFVQRVFTDAEIDEPDKGFLLALKEQYRNEYLCTLKVRDYIMKEYNKELTEDELIYLTVHLRRITSNN